HVRLCLEPEVNGVFVELAPQVYESLTRQGWIFHRFIGDHGYRLMCSWTTTEAEIEAFIGDLTGLIH
ncbi:MAG: threonine aldolase, partial [Opitutus sp.]